MEKLELKHLAPYLPYGLTGRVDKETYLQEENERIGELKTIDLADHNYELAVYGELGYFLCDITDFKPIIRPVSDLTKEIEHNGESFVPIDIIEQDQEFDYLADCGVWTQRLLEEQKMLCIELIPYGIIQKLFEWHFDVFGLIPKGLAIDINQLKTK